MTPATQRWHRLVADGDDVRVEARALNREQCIAEAALGVVTGFIDTSSVRKVRACRYRLHGNSDEEMLTAVLNKVIFLLGTAREIPVAVEITPFSDGATVLFATADSGLPHRSDARPKGVSPYQMRIGPDSTGGWRCSAGLIV